MTLICGLVEIEKLEFAGPPPDAAAVSREWQAMLGEARAIVDTLPAEEAGKCVLTSSGVLFSGGPVELGKALTQGSLLFHEGALRGALPRMAP